MDLSKVGDKRYKSLIALIDGRKTHSTKRALVRYGVQLDDFDYYGLVSQIIEKRAVFLKKFSKKSTRELWVVEFNGIYMCAVYEPRHDSICTFLSWEML